MDGAVISQNADLFYFSGTAQDAYLLVPSKGQANLFVKKSFERAKEESNLQKIMQIKSLKELSKSLIDRGIGTLGLELDVLPAKSYLYWRKLMEGVELVDVSTEILLQRMVKSDYEVEMVRDAAQLMDEVHQKIPEILTPGMTEIDFASQVEALARKRGHEGFTRFRGFNQELYFGHILSGESGGVPTYLDSPTGGSGLSPAFPQNAGRKEIEPHNPISVDYVGVVGGYISDQTRMYSIGELKDGELLEAFELALDIQEKLMKRAKPGRVAGEIFEIALRMADEAGYTDNFMGHGETRSQFVGHGVGLEVNELPIMGKGSGTTLEEGMIISFEPKFVFPDRGVVGIENTFMVGREDWKKSQLPTTNLRSYEPS